MPKVDPPLGKVHSKALTMTRAHKYDHVDLTAYNKIRLSFDGKGVALTHAKDATKNFSVKIERIRDNKIELKGVPDSVQEELMSNFSS